MQRTTGNVILSLAVFTLLASAAWADAISIALPQGAAKIVGADLVVVGQVLTIEDRDVEASPFPGNKNKTKYRIAVVQVTEPLKGDAKVKMVRVGYTLPAPIKPGLPPISSGGGYNVQLTVGQNGLFFLKKHHEGDFHTLPMFGTFVPADQKENYDRELKEARKTVKVMADPMASLKDKDAATRLETAATLVNLYRTPPFGQNFKQDQAGAEESKLILKILMEADWDNKKYPGEKYQQNPAQLFIKLGVTAKDGFQQPKGKGLFTPEYTQAAKTWLASNWQTYRIQKYTPTAGNPGGPIGGPTIDPAIPLPPPQALPRQPLGVPPLQQPAKQ